MKNGNGKAIVITGSSTGIGKACALALSGRGYRVYAGVRKSADADALKAESGGKIVPLIIDVTSVKSIAEAARAVETAEREIYAVVNNAGIVVAGPLEFVDIDSFRLQLETNVTGLLASTQAFLPLIRKWSRGTGRVVNVGSLSGLIATPFVGPYSASKFAVRALSDALRLELAPWKIQVSLIEPGPIATPIWEKSKGRANDFRKHSSPEMERYYGETLNRFEKTVDKTAETAVPVDVVVDAVIDSLESKRPRAYYPVGRAAKFQSALSHLLPQKILDQVVAKGAGLK